MVTNEIRALEAMTAPELRSFVRGVLERMWDDALWRLKLQAELEQTRRGPAPRRTRERKS